MVSPPPIEIATLGWEDSLLLMVLALVVFGPRRLPLIGRQIGKLMYEFRKASNDFKFQMEEELRNAEEADRRKKEEAERQRVAALAAESQASLSAPPQTLDAGADINTVAAPSASAEPDSPETSLSSEPAPTIQPPSTGEQVSTSARPDYFFESPAPEPAIAAEVNPEARVEANVATVAAGETAGVEAGALPGTANGQSVNPPPANPESSNSSNHHPGSQDLSPGTPSKEPVSQHG